MLTLVVNDYTIFRQATNFLQTTGFEEGLLGWKEGLTTNHCMGNGMYV